MALFKPTVMKNRLVDLDLQTLESLGIKGLVLDVDNTLSRHLEQTPLDGVSDFVNKMKSHGIKMIILSNSKRERVEPFAKLLSLDFEFGAKKPLCGGLNRAIGRMGLEKDKVLLCGDQLFTDMLCGNLSGVKTLLVAPVHTENRVGFKIKRFFERPFLRAYKKTKGDDKL